MVSVVGWNRAVQRFDYQSGDAGRLGASRQLRRIARSRGARRDGAQLRRHTGAGVNPLAPHAKLDGGNPTVLFGYGPYGITQNPNLNPRLLAWIERGGVYVFAHVRGGGILGTEWHLAGQKTTKPNTWRDAIAVAEWLIAAGYTSPQQLAINGGSAGGSSVGRAITQRPDLFAVAVPAVPVMDMVRFERPFVAGSTTRQ